MCGSSQCVWVIGMAAALQTWVRVASGAQSSSLAGEGEAVEARGAVALGLLNVASVQKIFQP